MRALTPTQLDRPRLALGVAVGVFALVGALVLILALRPAGPADAAKAQQLGKTKDTPSPSCPNNCAAVASVTGFQARADGVKQPFKVHEDGHLVAWSVALGKPDKKSKQFFGENFKNNEFGSDPSARLAVIKPKKKTKYKLKSQSPGVSLASEYGRTPLYTLNDPLRVKKGDVVALTVPTWSPNFDAGLSREGDTWRGSRSSKKCSDSLQDAKASKPHEEVGTTRRYGCKFSTSRILYWAYMVKDRKGGGGGNGGGNN